MCQLCQAPLHRAVFVGLSLALLASCASPSESGSTVETTEPPSSAADASAPEVPVELHCLEVVTLAGEEQPQYRRLTWYADRRALKVEFSSDPEFQSGNGAKVTAFASDGRLIRTIHLGGPDPQEDYFYDASNNRIDYRYSYPTSPSLDVASNEEPRLAILNKNEYDAQGRLAATIMAEYGLDSKDSRPFRRVFTEDDAGRCASIRATNAWNGEKREVFRYDARSRLLERELDSVEIPCGHKLSRYEYDDEDRLLAVQSECDGGPGSSELHTYNADGSETVEEIQMQSSSRTERGPACLLIDREIGKPESQHCRVTSRSN